MVRMELVVLLTALILLAAWPQGVPAATELPVPFATIAVGNHSGISTEAHIVARTLPEFEELWSRHTAGLPGPPPLPPVDFRRDMIIGVFAGIVPVPLRVSIVKITRRQDRLLVLVQVAERYSGPLGVEPGGGTPFHIVRLARLSLPAVFRPARPPSIYQRP